MHTPNVSLSYAALLALLTLQSLACNTDLGPPFGDEKDAGAPLCGGDEDDGKACAPNKHCQAGRCVTVPCEDTDSCDAGSTPELDAGCSDGTCPKDAGADASARDAANPSDARADAGPAATCGDGIVQAGEVCDRARITTTEAGVGQRVGCSADCKQRIDEDECEKCQQRECTKLEGINLVSGCFQKVDPVFGADENDPTFIAECIAVVDCAVRTNCAFQDDRSAAACYCGSATLDDCASNGPANDSPCLTEFRKATRTDNNIKLMTDWNSGVYPVKWAYLLLDCYIDRCAKECTKAN